MPGRDVGIYVFRDNAPGQVSAQGRIFRARYRTGALLAAFFPSHSERISVIRKVTAKSTFPRVCSMPKALIRISASIFARTVAMAERQ